MSNYIYTANGEYRQIKKNDVIEMYIDSYFKSGKTRLPKSLTKKRESKTSASQIIKPIIPKYH